MAQEIELAARAAQEIMPAVEEFASATGLTGPVKELAAWLTDVIKYRRASHLAKLLMRAAEKIRASGLPTRAVSDKVLRAVLEDGALEDVEEMRERWANLLANAATSQHVHVAYLDILRALEPAEARLLDEIARTRRTRPRPVAVIDLSLADLAGNQELTWANLDNLDRLGLIHYVVTTPVNVPVELPADTRVNLTETPLGSEFTVVCAPPRSAAAPPLGGGPSAPKTTA